MIRYEWKGRRYNVSANTYTDYVTLRPLYGDNCTIKHSMPDTERYYKESFNGTLKFVRDDYDWIMDTVSSVTPFGTIYELYLYADDGNSKQIVSTLKFTITDCQIDQDNNIITVKPTTKTRYDDILDGMDREFNLIDLNPVIENVTWYRRAVLHLYVAGESTLTNFLGATHWEQDVDSVVSSDLILKNTYYFALAKAFNELTITGSISAINGTYLGEADASFTSDYHYTLTPVVENGYYVRVTADVSEHTTTFEVKLTTTHQTVYHYVYHGLQLPDSFANDATWLDGNDHATGGKFNYHLTRIYARIICARWIENYGMHDRPSSDIVPFSHNMPYVMPYEAAGQNIDYSTQYSFTPTPYGLMGQQDGWSLYYLPPATPYEQYLPMSQETWGIASFWYNFVNGYFDESNLQKDMTLRHAYPLWSVIKVLLAEIAPSLTFDEDPAYSEFLFDYDENTHPITQFMPRLFLTPKSNILNGDYQTPAYNAPVKLKDILEMLKAVYRCYWFIDSSNRLRIEHVSWFMNGGSYTSDAATVSYDLTLLINPRNGKTWAYGKNTYTFDKPNMPSTKTFKWMDEVSQEFTGYQMEMDGAFVEKGKNEEIAAGNFTTDIDFVCIAPSDISKDGFMLLGADKDKTHYFMPFYPYRPDNSLPVNYLQNGFLAIAYLEKTNIWLADLPVGNVTYADGDTKAVWKQSRMKQQDTVVPMTSPIFDPVTLIKTGLGKGEIREIDINLSSLTGKAKLRYDTQQ